MLTAGVYDRLDAVISPDVAGVDANFVRAARRRFDGETVVEVDVRDERDGDILLNFTQRVRGADKIRINPGNIGVDAYE